MERNNAWKAYDETALNQVEAVAKSYRLFLDQGKTERECAKAAIETARAAGYVSLQDAIKQQKPVRPGDKLYCS